ncbi:MAG TPA: hypothetical protein PLB01_08735 [Thermoanaerobaculia bacterium]|nr:hypothetical protein [Thermoanaerobaculia bacterium]
MNVYWILSDDDAGNALEAVSRQVAEGDHGSPTLAGALGVLRFHAEIFNDAVLETERPFFAPAINAFRRGLTKLFWWYGLPQWGQVSEYQHAVSSVIDILLADQRRLRTRVADLEKKLTELEARAGGKP